jgi:L-lactate dehydrogenase
MSNNYKIGLIGCGAVGSSFLYSALNQGLGTKYVLIDAFPAAAQGNALDFADTAATVPTPFDYVKAGDYSDLSDADIVVITAGRPQIKKADGTLETRLEMVAGNSIIMKGIADSVKKSGFNGIVVIASNPVDVLTRIFQEESGFDSNKVIGSGTTLDSSRLRRLLGEKLDVNAQKIEADILGEHGDSSIAA